MSGGDRRLRPARAPAAVLRAGSGRKPLPYSFAHRLGRPVKILLIDDHFLIRAAISDTLRSVAPDAIIVEASNAAQAWRLVDAEPGLQLAVLDLSLPDGDGLSLLERLRRSHPALPVLVVSAETGQEARLRALELGAVGFIPKSASQPVMEQALRLVLAGGTYVPPEAIARAAGGGSAGNALPPPGRPSPEFTTRQLDVLALIVQGRSNKWIGRALDLAEPTVKHHVTAILKALNATNRTEAALAAAAMKLKLPPLK